MSTYSELAGARGMLRHTVATLAYRAHKVLRDAPTGLAERRPGPSSRSGLQLLDHLGDLLEWGARMARGDRSWQAASTGDWAAAALRFERGLEALDAAIATAADADALQRVFQGPIADALTHVGQLALLRGLCGAPVRPESYARADIAAGRVGRDQPAPRLEFDGDASAPRS